MKNNQKFLLLIFGLLICLSLFFIVQIYAKYLTSVSGNTSISIARWNISVNDKSIKNNSDISAAVVPVLEGNEHLSPNVIAPTAEGYFDLDFDFSDADVSFEYNINVSAASNSPTKDIVATGYSIDGGEKVIFDNFDTPISGTVLLGENVTKRKYRIYILWNDDSESSTMTDEDDTETTKLDVPALLNVNVSFTQIAE